MAVNLQTYAAAVAALAELSGQSARLWDGALLEAERIDCFMDALQPDSARYAEAHGMLNDMEAREGFKVDTARALLGTRVADMLAQYPNGTRWHTGGGCSAWRHPLDNGGYILVTEEDSYPEESTERFDCGVYSGADDDNGDVDSMPLSALEAWIDLQLLRGSVPVAAATEKLREAAPALAEALEGYRALVAAVVDNWERGDLAAAVNALDEYANTTAEAALASAGIT